MPPRIAFRADCNNSVGKGHLSRCLALCEELERRLGPEIFFLMRDSAEAERIVSGRGFTFCPLPGTGFDSDLAGTSDFLASERIDVAVLDRYGLDERYLAEAGKSVRVLAVVSDFVEFPSYPCDVIINQNIYAGNERYACPEGTARLLGLGYAMLRDEFFPASPRQVREKVEKVLLTFGASYREGIAASVIDAVADFGPELDVVVGDNPGVERAARDRPNVRLLKNVGNMAELMRSADFAFSGAGVTFYEELATQLPSALVCVADNQRKIVSEANEKGLALCLGRSADVSARDFRRAFEKLSDPGFRRGLVGKMAGLIDGKGKERIAGAIEEKLSAKPHR